MRTAGQRARIEARKILIRGITQFKSGNFGLVKLTARPKAQSLDPAGSQASKVRNNKTPDRNILESDERFRLFALAYADKYL